MAYGYTAVSRWFLPKRKIRWFRQLSCDCKSSSHQTWRPYRLQNPSIDLSVIFKIPSVQYPEMEINSDDIPDRWQAVARVSSVMILIVMHHPRSFAFEQVFTRRRSCSLWPDWRFANLRLLRVPSILRARLLLSCGRALTEKPNQSAFLSTPVAVRIIGPTRGVTSINTN